MTDKILERFLERQYEDGTALASQSDLVNLVPLGERPYRRYVVQLRCLGLRRAADGEITEMSYSEAGVEFPDDYLRRVDPYRILVWISPRDVWHPNISDKAPMVCLGRLGPGTRLTEIVYQLADVVSYKKFATHDALNHAAAAWARQHQDRFPVDPRPLKRRTLGLRVTPLPGPSAHAAAEEAV